MKKLTIVFLFLLLGASRLEALSCNLYNADQVSFGIYSSALIRVTTTVHINCDAGATYTIGLSQGQHGSSVTNRLMANGALMLSYQLFSNASYTLNWGDASSLSTEVSGTGQGTQDILVYAQVPANQAFFATANGGNYSDIVVMTLTCSNCANVSGSGGTLGINLGGVAVGCTIEANDLNFGNYTGTALNATTTLRVGCSSETKYNVGLSAGTASGATVTSRSMTRAGGTALLGYMLRRDSYTGTNWGNTVGTDTKAGDTVAGAGSGAVQSLTVFGVIPAGQTVTLGTYTDTITATLTY